MAKGKTEKAITKRHAGMWKPGQSGNLGGRPKRPDRERYTRIMRETCTDEKWAMICARAVQDAIDGSHPARRWLGDYMVGPPIKQSELVVSGDVSLSGPSLDRRVKQIMAVFAAVLVVDDDDDQISIAPSIPDVGDIIDGVIVDKNEETS